jgi:hypothetical protein
MARPSRWMQFTQNFNAMNSTMNDAFKKYETGKASKSEDYFSDELDDEGNKVKLSGNDLKFAKNNAIADIYDKYGDQEGAMKLRTGNEELQGLMRDNRIGKATEASRIQVEGQGAVDAQQAGIGASKAATSASEAASALSGYQLENLQQQRNRDETLTSIFTGLGEQEFESDADETAYVLNKLQDSGLPPNMINQGVEAFKTFGSNKIAMESDRLTRAAGEAMQGGVSAFEKFYNTEISDGGTLDIVQEDGNTVAYVMTGEGENQTREVLYTGKGETGQMEVLNSLYQSVKSPGEILESAVQNLSYAQGQADLKQTGSQIKKIDSEVDVNEAQIDKIESGIKVDDATIGRIASQNKVDTAQISQIQSTTGLTDARALQVAAETVLIEGLKTDLLTGQIADLKEQTKARGVSSQLDEEQIVHLAAKTAQINFNMDPERPMTRVEVDREWADFTAKMALQGFKPEKIAAMENYFYTSIRKDRTNGFTVKPVDTK